MTKAWKEKRADITRLYIHENKTLNEVRAIMEEHHDFKASTRSYRQQFDKWGLAKYNCKKRTARRRSQDDGGGGQYHHQGAGQYYPAPAVGGAPGEGGIAPDFPVTETDAYGQPMSPQSCDSSLSSESAVDGGPVDDVMDAVEGSYAENWQPQLPYIEQGPQQQQQQQQEQGVYPRYPQEQHQRHQDRMQQGRRRRPSWEQQTAAAMQSPYGPLPSPPADLHDGGSSHYFLFADEEASLYPSQPGRAQAYPVLPPDPRRRGTYPYEQARAQCQYHQRQQQQQQQMYSSTALMPARRETVPFYDGVQCAVRQSGQQ